MAWLHSRVRGRFWQDCIARRAEGPCARAGVLPFAKRGDDRGNNLVRLQQMFPRIVAADFQQPLHVSLECKHLLARMLTPDPSKRITVAEIMQHPWCAAWRGSPAHSPSGEQSSSVLDIHLLLPRMCPVYNLPNPVVASLLPSTCVCRNMLIIISLAFALPCDSAAPPSGSSAAHICGICQQTCW